MEKSSEDGCRGGAAFCCHAWKSGWGRSSRSSEPILGGVQKNKVKALKKQDGFKEERWLRKPAMHPPDLGVTWRR